MKALARAILFDLDGTLLNSFDLIAASFRYAGRAVLGREFTDHDVAAHWGEPLSRRFAAIDSRRIPDLIAAYTAHYELYHEQMAAPFPGVLQMLRALAHRGFRLGVVTSKRRRPMEQALEAFGFAPYIEGAVCAEDVVSPKPAPDSVVEAARRLSIPAGEAWMVGDGVFDIQAAHAAGTVSVAALWGTREREALLASNPDYVAERPADVVALVSG